jgi:processive 1,2-diacylglycerol beta-glucosyltransferase
MIQLRDKDTGAPLGAITDEQLQFLVDELEEESSDDRDYFIDQATLEMFDQHGIDASLLDTLRRARGGRDGIEVEWSRA